MMKIKGHLIEVGDFNVCQQKQSAKRAPGVVIECDDRNLTILGLTRDEAMAMGRLLLDPVEVHIGRSATDGGTVR